MNGIRCRTFAFEGIAAILLTLVFTAGLAVVTPNAYATEGDLQSGQIPEGELLPGNSEACIAYSPEQKGDWAFLTPQFKLPDSVNGGSVLFNYEWQWSPNGSEDSWKPVDKNSKTDKDNGQLLEVLTNDETIGTYRRYILTMTQYDGATGEVADAMVIESNPVQILVGSGFRVDLEYVPVVAGEVATFQAKPVLDPDDDEVIDLSKIYYEWQMSVDNEQTWIGEDDEGYPDLLRDQSGVGCTTLRIPTKPIAQKESNDEVDAGMNDEGASDENAAPSITLIRVVAHHDGKNTPSNAVPFAVRVSGDPKDPDDPEDPDKRETIEPVVLIDWTRLSGETALDTMRAIVQKGFQDEGGTVVVATIDGYWDALAASGLAGLADAPVLMADGQTLSTQTAHELKRLAPSKVLVCGGPAAVSDDVCDMIQMLCGVEPQRIAGATAVDTAAQINAFGPGATGKVWSKEAFLCTSNGYWDALAAAPVAYAKHMPIFLTESDGTLSKSTLQAIRNCGITKVHIVGGTSAVPASAESTLGDLMGGRLDGEDAIKTSEHVARFGLSHDMTVKGMGVATTEGYWDALSGAAFCGKNNSVLVLVKDANSSSINDFVGSYSKEAFGSFVFGGPAAVPDDVLTRLQSITK